MGGQARAGEPGGYGAGVVQHPLDQAGDKPDPGRALPPGQVPRIVNQGVLPKAILSMAPFAFRKGRASLQVSIRNCSYGFRKLLTTYTLPYQASWAII